MGDVDGPDVDIDGTGKGKGKFGFKKPDIHMPDINMPDIHLPSINFGGKGGANADAEVSGPGKPHVDIELDINAPKVKGPEVDVDIEGPNMDVDVDAPDV